MRRSNRAFSANLASYRAQPRMKCGFWSQILRQGQARISQRAAAMRKLLIAALIALPAVALADGKATYDKMCASCHGADGKGNPAKAKVLKIDEAKLSLARPDGAKPDAFKDIVLKGKEKMPAYEKKLAPADVDPVVDYSKTLAGKK